MENQLLFEELKTNCESNNEKLRELFKCYELAKLGYDLQEQRIHEVYNRVLAENDFRASVGCDRLGVCAGDRIMDEDNSFLMSQEDFDRYNAISLPVMVSEGLTDEKGFFIEDWIDIRYKARKALVDFLIDEVVPKSMREVIANHRGEVLMEDKLIDAFRKCA